MKFFAPQTPAPHFFVEYLRENQLLTEAIGEASFLVLPFMYEVVHDYSTAELQSIGINEQQKEELKALAMEMEALSIAFKKKLIVFFYRDPVVALPFTNALIFRTSGFNSKAFSDTFGMPALVDNRPINAQIRPREKQEMPKVSFRGKAAPIRLSLTIYIRDTINRIFSFAHLGFKVKNFEPEGYLLRRRALISCIKEKSKLENDFLINPNAKESEYKDGYLNSFLEADYFLCVSGFGNYSFRLFEVMRQGRIPAYIDTDALLPCVDVIDWKKIMIWIPEKEVDKTASYIHDFHRKINPNDFKTLQQQIREIYLKYLTKEGFSKYLVHILLPKQL